MPHSMLELIVIKMASLDVYRRTRKQDRIGFKQIINHFLRRNFGFDMLQLSVLSEICQNLAQKSWHIFD